MADLEHPTRKPTDRCRPERDKHHGKQALPAIRIAAHE
jgi:hypothetical protein